MLRKLEEWAYLEDEEPDLWSLSYRHSHQIFAMKISKKLYKKPSGFTPFPLLSENLGKWRFLYPFIPFGTMELFEKSIYYTLSFNSYFFNIVKQIGCLPFF